MEVEATNSCKLVRKIFRLKSKSLGPYDSYKIMANVFSLFIAAMANTLSLCSLLDNSKLTEPNFDSWYHKLKIMLEHEKILYVLTDPASEEPTVNAYGAVRDAFQKWLNNRMMVHCIIRATMNDEFSRKFEDAQPEAIFQILYEYFGIPEDAERYKISCAVFNIRM